MNKTIIFSNLGGMPFDQQTLEFMQSAYKDIALMLASMIGDNVIVAGCVATGDNVSAGWVIVNGELYPFEATQTGVKETFVIRELETPLVFEDGNSKPVEITKYARFGTADDSVRWDSLTRLNPYKALSDHIDKRDNPHKVTKDQVGLGNLPNAKTDDPSISSSDILASIKAVNSMYEKVKVVEVNVMLGSSPATYSGEVQLGFDAEAYACIPDMGDIASTFNVAVYNFYIQTPNGSSLNWVITTQRTVYSSTYARKVKVLFVKK